MKFSRFQASIFSDLSSIDAAPEKTISILQRLLSSGYPFVSGVVQEFNAQTMAPSQRLRLSSVDGLHEIVILSSRLDIAKHVNVFEGKEIGEIDDFIVFVKHAVEAVFGGVNVQGNRLALISQCVSGPMSGGDLNEVSSSFFHFDEFYKETVPFEWTYRLASKRNLNVGQAVELANAILKVERMQGKVVVSGGQTDFDRIFSEIDVNTSAEATLNRFDSDDFYSFLDGAKGLTLRLFDSACSMVKHNHA